jgi:hypothetical protein
MYYSVLTDANISQLLRLSLSKAVYPTVDIAPVPMKGLKGGEKAVLTPFLPQIPILLPQWEMAFSRIGLRRLLCIPEVLSSDSAVNEVHTYIFV